MPRKTEAWERQKGESAKAFEAFAAYRDMGPCRSLRALARKRSKSIATIFNWSAKYNWVERAREWDNFQDEQERIALEKQRKDATRRRLARAQKLQDRAERIIDSRNDNKVPMKDAIEMMRLGMEQEDRVLGLGELAIKQEELKLKQREAEREEASSRTDHATDLLAVYALEEQEGENEEDRSADA